MSIRVLERKASGNIKVFDGIVNNYINAGAMNGTLPQVLGGCALSHTVNSITLATGYLYIRGIRVVVDEAETVTFASLPAEKTAYQLVMKLTLESGDVTRELQARPHQTLTRDDLLKHGYGVYEYELANFYLSQDGISSLINLIDVINIGGGAGGGVGFVPEGIWSADRAYGITKEGISWVSYEGQSFYAIQKTIPVGTLPTDTAYWATGATGNGIATIAKTGTTDNVDTYTITFDDGTTTTFTVKNANVANTTNILIGDGNGNAVDSGISASVVLDANLNTLTAVKTTGNPVNIKNTNDGFVDTIGFEGGKNLISNNVADWEQGSVNESLAIGTTYSDTKLTSTTRIRTKELIRVKNPITFSFNDSLFDVFITLFDENQLYLGQFSGWKLTTFTETRNCEYMAITVRKKDNSTITASDIETVFLQGELGSTATDYEPYTVISSPLTGKSVGKNLFNIGGLINNDVAEKYNNGLKLTRKATGRFSEKIPMSVPAGTYRLSYDIIEQTTPNILRRVFYIDDSPYTIPMSGAYNFTKDVKSIEFFADVPDAEGTGYTIDNIQIEKGSTSTDYEPYTATGFSIPLKDTSGTVLDLNPADVIEMIDGKYHLNDTELHDDSQDALRSIATKQGQTNLIGDQPFTFDVTEFQLGLESIDAMLTLPNGTRVNVLTKDRLIYITSGEYKGKTLDYVLQEVKQNIDLKANSADLDLKAPLLSPTFTGTPIAPTPSATDNSTKLATTAFVQTSKMFKLVSSEPYSAGTPFSLPLTDQGAHPISAWYVQFSSDLVQIRLVDGNSGFRVSATGSTLTTTPLAESGYTAINVNKYCGLRILCAEANSRLSYQLDGCWSVGDAVLGEFGRADSPSGLKFYSATAGTAYLYRVGADV